VALAYSEASLPTFAAGTTPRVVGGERGEIVVFEICGLET
jgi:hypothetical protein